MMAERVTTDARPSRNMTGCFNGADLGCAKTTVVDNVTTYVVTFLRRPLLTSARVALP
jgi:hypothetical protein